MLARHGELQYPWSEAPRAGEAREVAPGIFWARLPLPFRLNHVNVWLVEEDDGWTVIDTGCATPQILSAWESLFAGPMRGRPVTRVIATHGHVDHIGMSGWMVSRFDAEYVGTFAEWMWARVSHMHDVPGSAAAHHSYLVRNGFDEAAAAGLVQSRRRFIDLSSPVPGSITEIRDGETIRMGGRDWRVIVTRGHAFEHASFHDPDSGVLIAGDHLLPRISPVIAVYEMMPKADPLADYLASFPQFDGIADGTLILPSHGSPYFGIRTRIEQLRHHHEERLDAAAEFLRQPRTAAELATEMFPQIEGPENIGFALGETLAHVNFLVNKGRARDVSDTTRTALFQTEIS
jgi:glyoxylase-like metal-dependent hydrolase (beta-lactamase superfamily II)